MREDPRVALYRLRPMIPPASDGSPSRSATIWQPTAEEIDLIFPLARDPGHMADGRVPDSVGPLVRQRTLEGQRAIVRVVPKIPPTYESRGHPDDHPAAGAEQDGR